MLLSRWNGGFWGQACVIINKNSARSWVVCLGFYWASGVYYYKESLISLSFYAEKLPLIKIQDPLGTEDVTNHQFRFTLWKLWFVLFLQNPEELPFNPEFEKRSDQERAFPSSFVWKCQRLLADNENLTSDVVMSVMVTLKLKCKQGRREQKSNQETCQLVLILLTFLCNTTKCSILLFYS